MTEQRKNLRKYIVPAMIGNLSFFVLTIVDGMFVGNGVGPDALGAVSLAMPFVNFIWALSTLFNIGGVAVASVRLGREDVKGANLAFMHSLSANVVVFSIISVMGMLMSEKSHCCSERMKPICKWFRITFSGIPCFCSPQPSDRV